MMPKIHRDLSLTCLKNQYFLEIVFPKHTSVVYSSGESFVSWFVVKNSSANFKEFCGQSAWNQQNQNILLVGSAHKYSVHMLHCQKICHRKSYPIETNWPEYQLMWICNACPTSWYTAFAEVCQTPKEPVYWIK